jgi:protein-L-isoaspartate(D-aspartate) O-methyltransferase
VVLEGATAIVPHALCQQLKNGGRLVCVLGAGPGSKAMLYTRSSGEVGGRPVFDAAAALLPGFAETPVFAF